MIMRSLVVLCISFISDDSLLTFCKGKKREQKLQDHEANLSFNAPKKG